MADSTVMNFTSINAIGDDGNLCHGFGNTYIDPNPLIHIGDPVIYDTVSNTDWQIRIDTNIELEGLKLEVLELKREIENLKRELEEERLKVSADEFEKAKKALWKN